MMDKVYKITHPKFKTTKTIVFLRHGQTRHNFDASKFETLDERRNNVYRKKEYLDSELNEEGINQAKNLNELMKKESKFDLIVVSPLTRTLQTMEYAFEEIDCPRIVHPLVREHFGDYYTDSYRDMDEIIPRFKGVDFSLVNDKIDPAISMREREKWEDMDERSSEFLEWLSQRNEEKIAVVSHSSFLKRFFAKFVINDISDEGLKSMAFSNSEVRVLEINPVNNCI